MADYVNIILHNEKQGNIAFAEAWKTCKGYALTDEAVANSASETIWCSPHCVPVVLNQSNLF